MNAREATREAVKSVCCRLYPDAELEAAYDEVRQCEQDFELAEPEFVESAELYLAAAKARLSAILRERRKRSAKGITAKEEGV